MAELSEIGAIARRSDPDRFLCALFAAPERREALFTLIAFNNELARAREVVSQPMMALIRLQWWRDSLDEMAAGRPVRRHEVAGPLHALVTAGVLDAADLQAMVDAREAEAEEIESRGAFESYLRGSAGGFAVAAGRLLGAPPALLPALQSAGAGYGLAGVLRTLPLQARQGRNLLPVEMLAEAGAEAEGIAPDAPAVVAVARRLAAEALPVLEQARKALRDLPKPAVAAALPLVLARRDLRRIADGADLVQPPGPRGGADRLAVAWAGLRGRV
ncbi:Phytoene synthase family protein [Roseomonas mucosa]|uniref:phytoene/squalene synthase family protein n=1 Tax=Roseomonas mucosa TaxID=207340 RepID=UPI00220A003C|nr:squalene/phytoene synthase family protein [Roseomonas mucosa]QDJ10048.1 Phytoene synthase family protein [Roseomonas mucosa]